MRVVRRAAMTMRGRSRAGIWLRGLALTALFLPGAYAAAQDRAEEQVPMIGSDGPNLDACGGIGRVATLGPHLTVRERPEDYAREKDRLIPNTLVWLCEGGDDWQGIVYPKGEHQDLGDCRVSSPVAAPQPYSGPCRSGWVLARDLRLVAG